MARTSGLTRPSKLRLPESTAAATRSSSLIALEISGGSGPELPMQVVQPKPTRLKPSLSRSFCRPDLSRYSATTWEPGASEVLTQGLTVRPCAAALRASRPAPIMTFGFEVLVHEVIAAITTSPWPRSCLRPCDRDALFDLARLAEFLVHRIGEAGLDVLQGDAVLRALGTGERGLDRARSSLRMSVKIGSGVVLVRNMPCALA